MSDDDAPTPETPGYRLWAAMNDAETYEPPLSETDIWEYAANTFLDNGDGSLHRELKAYITALRNGQYVLPATGVTDKVRIAIEAGVWDAIADDLTEMTTRAGNTIGVKELERVYTEAFEDYERHIGSQIRFGRMDALAAVLSAVKNGVPVVLNPTGTDVP